ADSPLPSIWVLSARPTIEDVEGHTIFVVHDGLAEFHVGLVAKVLALVEKAFAVLVNEETQLENVDCGDTTLKRRRTGIEHSRMETPPLPRGQATDPQSNLQAFASVVARAAQDDIVHEATKVTPPHLRVGFETATRNDNAS